MGQKLIDDNIPKTVVASTTTITLAITSGGQSTSVTIGGQSYQPTSLITLNAATVGANGLDAGALGASQLWYVYAIANQSTFAMALVASLSATPTMPTGYGTAYKLVGGFNTNASSQVSFTVTPEDGVVYPVSAGNVIGRMQTKSVGAEAYASNTGLGTLVATVFNNLTIGNSYKVSGGILSRSDSGTTPIAVKLVCNGADVIGNSGYTFPTYPATAVDYRYPVVVTFVAAGTTLGVYAFGSNTSARIRGGDLTIEEVSPTSITTAFT